MRADGKRDLIERTRQFALRIVRLYASLPTTAVAQVMGKQLLRAGTSVGAHYREAQRARSTAEFLSKIDGGRQELEETMYWLELLREGGNVKPESAMAKEIASLHAESNELMAILTACARSAKARRDNQ